MTDDELRLLVRTAVARHFGRTEDVPEPVRPPDVAPPPPWRAHPSFGRFLIARPARETDCLVEPGVTCTHCGFCQSYGH